MRTHADMMRTLWGHMRTQHKNADTCGQLRTQLRTWTEPKKNRTNTWLANSNSRTTITTAAHWQLDPLRHLYRPHYTHRRFFVSAFISSLPLLAQSWFKRLVSVTTGDCAASYIHSCSLTFSLNDVDCISWVALATICDSSRPDEANVETQFMDS